MADALRKGYLEHLEAQRVAIRELRATLKEAARESRRLVLSIPQGASISELERRGRAASALNAIEELHDGLWADMSATTQRRMRQAGIAAERAFEEIAGVLAEGIDPVLVPPEFRTALRAAARQRVRNITNNYLAERRLSDTVYRNSQWTKKKVRGIVRQGLAQGTSARSIASQVQGFISPTTPGGARYAAFRLARTEINNTFHVASIRSAKDSPWLVAMKWELSGSHGAPDECDDIADDSSGRGYDRGEYRIEDVPDKPHPNCLCYTTEITPSDEAFAEALVSGQYNEWLGENGLATF